LYQTAYPYHSPHPPPWPGGSPLVHCSPQPDTSLQVYDQTQLSDEYTKNACATRMLIVYPTARSLWGRRDTTARHARACTLIRAPARAAPAWHPPTGRRWRVRTSWRTTRWYGLADTARHVIQRTFNPRFLSEMASYDVVGLGGYCSPRHPTHFQPSSLESETAPCDVTTTSVDICRTLRGEGHRLRHDPRVAGQLVGFCKLSTG